MRPLTVKSANSLTERKEHNSRRRKRNQIFPNTRASVRFSLPPATPPNAGTGKSAIASVLKLANSGTNRTPRVVAASLKRIEIDAIETKQDASEE